MSTLSVRLCLHFLGLVSLLDVTFAKICDEYEDKDCLDVEPTPEVLSITIVLCIGALLSIICPIICLIKPCNKKWKKILGDKLGWEFPSRSTNTNLSIHQVEYGHQPSVNQMSNSTNQIAFIDLPPSYEEVVKNSEMYKQTSCRSQHQPEAETVPGMPSS